jgi:hypothetical protein
MEFHNLTDILMSLITLSQPEYSVIEFVNALLKLQSGLLQHQVILMILLNLSFQLLVFSDETIDIQVITLINLAFTPY